jgi:hypothetical protein
MRTVKTKRVVKHNGIEYSVGDTISMDSGQAKTFVSRGFGEFTSAKEVETTDKALNDLMAIDGMKGEIAVKLIENNFTIQLIAEASPKELALHKGIGKALAIKFIDSAGDLLSMSKENE